MRPGNPLGDDDRIDLRGEARRARRRYRHALAARYDRERFFRTVPVDVAGIDLLTLGAERTRLAGDPRYTEKILAALRRQLRALIRIARARHAPTRGLASEAEILRVAILGEIALLRRQRMAAAQIDGLAHLNRVLAGARMLRSGGGSGAG